VHTLLKICAKAAADGQGEALVSLSYEARQSEQGVDEGEPQPEAEAAASSELGDQEIAAQAVASAVAAQNARLSKLKSATTVSSGFDEQTDLRSAITGTLKHFTRSAHAEVQERACFGLAVIEAMQSETDAQSVRAMFVAELKPVGVNAQRNVAKPESLDLDTPIHVAADGQAEGEEQEEDEEERAAAVEEEAEDGRASNQPYRGKDVGWDLTSTYTRHSNGSTSGNTAAVAAAAVASETARRMRAQDDPFYLAEAPARSTHGTHGAMDTAQSVSPSTEGAELFALGEQFLRKKSKSKSKRYIADGGGGDTAGNSRVRIGVHRVEGDDGDSGGRGECAPIRHLHICSSTRLLFTRRCAEGASAERVASDPFSRGLDEPLGDDEVLPQIQAYARATPTYSGLTAGSQSGKSAGMDWMAEARPTKAHKKSKHKSKQKKNKHKHKHKKSKRKMEDTPPDWIPDAPTPVEPVPVPVADAAQQQQMQPGTRSGGESVKHRKRSKAKE
jgi:hypothetical protein